MLIQLLVLLIGVLAGFADSTAGVGGLISIPSLIFLGFPPQVAIATDRLGSVGQSIGATVSFWKSKKIEWRYVIPFSILALIGAFIGAHFLLQIDPKNLVKIIGIILLLALPTMYVKNLNLKTTKLGRLKNVFGYIVYFILRIYNGFFGTGSGPLTILTMTMFFDFTIIESNATTAIPWLILSLTSLIIFTQNNIVNYINGITLLLGMMIGGYLGAHFQVKIGETWVRRIFVVVVIVSACKLLFF